MHAIRIVTFTAVLALLVGGTHVYLYRRLFRDTWTNRHWKRWGATMLAVLASSAVLARLAAAVLPLYVARVFSGIGLLWLALAIYLLLALVALDLGRLLGRTFRRRLKEVPAAAPVQPERRLFLARAAGVGALAVAGGASGFGVFRAYHPPRVSEVPIRLRGLPKALDGFTLVQLSDVHAGTSVHEAWMEELVVRCSALRPDALVITGDLVDGSVPRLGELIGKLERVPVRAGRWFVTGNHDYYAGADAWCAALTKMGIQPLRNRRVSLGGGAGEPSFDLVGVDDQGQISRRDGTGYDLDRAVEGRDVARPGVLLAHRPLDFEQAADLGIGLQLSGHTHGGQTFPFTAVAQVVWSRCAGLYEHGEARMYVSRGVGFVGPPLRAGSPPEIVRITLLA